MSDAALRRPEQPGAAPGAAPAPQLRENESILNPNDAARMQSRGAIRPDMSVREALQVMGIDVDGPISQITPQLSQQVQNATLQGKVQNTNPQAAGPEAGGGMDALLRGR